MFFDCFCVSTFICLKIYFDFLFDFFVDISCLIASCVGSTFFMFLKFSSCILISQEKGLKLRMNCLIEIAETKVVWMKGEGCLSSNGAASFQYI